MGPQGRALVHRWLCYMQRWHGTRCRLGPHRVGCGRSHRCVTPPCWARVPRPRFPPHDGTRAVQPSAAACRGAAPTCPAEHVHTVRCMGVHGKARQRLACRCKWACAPRCRGRTGGSGSSFCAGGVWHLSRADVCVSSGVLCGSAVLNTAAGRARVVLLRGGGGIHLDRFGIHVLHMLSGKCAGAQLCSSC